MIKQKTMLEVIKDERSYELHLSDTAPLGEIYDVLNQMRNYIIQRIEQENKAQEEAAEKALAEAKKAKADSEEVKEEVEQLLNQS